MNEPLVSILMNCYNGEEYLREAIESILSQTYQNWEIIFWDNQSTDSSAEIFKSYNDNRFKYYYAPLHTDLGGGRAAAWPYLTGEFIAVLDTDDVWLPEKLTKQIPLFDDSEVGIVISDTLFFNENNEKPLYNDHYPPTGYVFDKLLSGYFVSLETLVFRRATALSLSRAFDPDFNAIADFDLVVRISRVSKLAIYPEVLAKWRVHENSDTWKYPMNFYEEKVRWIQKQISEDPAYTKKFSLETKTFINKNLRTKVTYELARGRHLSAFKILIKSDFDHWHSWVLLTFCFIPFSGYLIKYLNKRKAEIA